MTRILDGKAVASLVKADVAARASAFAASQGRSPRLEVVLVGDDPASQVYVRNKEKAALECGLRGSVVRLPEATKQAELEAFVGALSNDDDVDGILVQLPLPKGLDAARVIRRIDPAKDVDGLHPENAGALVSGETALRPCTPRGCMRLLDETGADLAGKVAVVIGRSNLVGKPLALMLLEKSATVTVAHSRTRDLAALCSTADVLVAAVGKAKLVKRDWVKPGAIVIDVGINRDENNKLCGDVAFDEASENAAWITPVPGGVGAMTIAMLLDNTVIAAEARASAK
jgi:methylenetetrahydrofolate dehydrogenase (NADP+)/methenyltetrahydrofolate cyclohydrolase